MSEELIKFTELSNVPQILEANKLSVTNAKNAGLNLINKIDENGMTEEIDQECNNFLVKCKKTVEAINEKRKPITSILTAISKEFTSLEAELDPKRPESVYFKIQAYRNKHATEKLEMQRKKEEAAQLKRDKENEKIELREKIEVALSDFINNIMDKAFLELQGIFNSITLENINDNVKLIEAANVLLTDAMINELTFQIPTKYLIPEEKKAVKNEVFIHNIDKYKAMFKAEMTDFKKALIDRIPSKKTELEAIAKAEKDNAELAKQLQEAKEKREKAEKEKAEKEALERKEKAENEAKAKAEESKMQTLFEQTSETVSADGNTPERTGYNMVVTHPSAFMQIFALWFEHEGKNLGIDAIEKKTIKMMKTFCEKFAHTNDVKIESKLIKYEEIVKVRAKS